MVPLESRNNPPQELLPSVDKTRNPQNSAELEVSHFDVQKSHASALLGFIPVEAPSDVGHTPLLALGVEQIRAKRRTHWEETGEVPPIVGGSPHSAREQQAKKYWEAEEKWRVQAIELGLPVDATYDEFLVQRDMKRRKEITNSVKWSLDPKLTEKAERLGDDPYPGWETILYYTLNVAGSAAVDMTTEELAERIKLVRKLLSKIDKE